MTQEKSGHHGHRHRRRSSEGLVNPEIIFKELNLRPGQVILDAGCGNGHIAKAFSRALQGTGKVWALDPDEEAIAALRDEVKDSNIIPIIGDITAVR